MNIKRSPFHVYSSQWPAVMMHIDSDTDDTGASDAEENEHMPLVHPYTRGVNYDAVSTPAGVLQMAFCTNLGVEEVGPKVAEDVASKLPEDFSCESKGDRLGSGASVEVNLTSLVDGEYLALKA